MPSEGRWNFYVKSKASGESVPRASAARKIFFFFLFTSATRREDRRYKILLGDAGDYGTFPRDNIRRHWKRSRLIFPCLTRKFLSLSSTCDDDTISHLEDFTSSYISIPCDLFSHIWIYFPPWSGIRGERGGMDFLSLFHPCVKIPEIRYSKEKCFRLQIASWKSDTAGRIKNIDKTERQL